MTLPDRYHASSSQNKKPQPNLLSLGSDIHHRIVDYLQPQEYLEQPSRQLQPSQAILNLAMTCRTMQAVVASRIKTDRDWWPTETFKTPPSLFHWYRICGSSLTNVCFTSDKTPCYEVSIEVLNRVLHILISNPPPVRTLDISVFSCYVPREMHASLSLFLQCIQTTLEEINFSCSAKLFNCLVQTRLPRLVSVSMNFEFCEIRWEVRSVRDLLCHFARESHNFSRLSVRIHNDEDMFFRTVRSELPRELGKVTKELALRSLSLENCYLSMNTVGSLICSPALEDVQLHSCRGESHALKVLLLRPNLVSRISLWPYLSTRDIENMSKCTRLNYLSMSLPNGLVRDVAKYLPRFKVLSELFISTLSLSVISEELLLSALSGCKSIQKIHLCLGYRIKHSYIKRLLISQRSTLEALQVSVQTYLGFGRTHEAEITELFDVVRVNNQKLRRFDLCTGLKIDPLNFLRQELREAIDMTEQAVDGLKIVIRWNKSVMNSDLGLRNSYLAIPDCSKQQKDVLELQFISLHWYHWYSRAPTPGSNRFSFAVLFWWSFWSLLRHVGRKTSGVDLVIFSAVLGYTLSSGFLEGVPCLFHSEFSFSKSNSGRSSPCF